MIHFLSLIASIIILFFAGGNPNAASQTCCGQDSREAGTYCQQISTEKDSAEAGMDCCGQEEQSKDADQEPGSGGNTSDCCGNDDREMNDCCRQETEEISLPDNIPDCCGS